METEAVSRRKLFVASTATLACSQAHEGRGVILLIGDDHSPLAGCYGNDVIATPNLDRLAREGTRFTNALCTAAGSGRWDRVRTRG